MKSGGFCTKVCQTVLNFFHIMLLLLLLFCMFSLKYALLF